MADSKESREEVIAKLEEEYTDENGHIDYKRLYGRGGPLDSGSTNYVLGESRGVKGGNDPILRKYEYGGNPSNLTVKVTADVNDAITGFKALSRELRETTKAARELEQAYEDVEIAINDFEGAKLVGNNVYLDGKKIGKVIAPTVKDLQAETLKNALQNEPNIPDRLREDLLAKISEDEAIIAELERKIGDLSEVSTKELHEELTKRDGVEEYIVENRGCIAKLLIDNGTHGFTETVAGPARIPVNKD